jgi:hypothetical protein
LTEKLTNELARQRTKMNRIKKDTDEEHKKDGGAARKEMDNRFDQ